MKKIGSITLVLFCAISLAFTGNSCAQTKAAVDQHLELSFSLAADGKKTEAIAERKQAIETFEKGLRFNPGEFSEYSKSDCKTLLKQEVEHLKTIVENLNRLKELARQDTQDGDKLCPLADSFRRNHGRYALIATTEIYKRCLPEARFSQTRAEAAEGWVKSYGRIFCQSGKVKVMLD